MEYLTIGFVRRGFSSGGGAEAYLKRLASGLVERGHKARLYTSREWPDEEWTFGPVIRLDGRSSMVFADELEQTQQKSDGDVLMSLERIWRCHVYRAGDGVHQAWLRRRAEVGGPFRNLGRVLNRKHSAALTLEESLLRDGGASQVIANSKMVKSEIVRFHQFPAEKIHVIPNGVPVSLFQRAAENRRATRERLGLKDSEIAVLFAGTGWERKGLQFAIEAVEKSGFSLLVAGRGDERAFRSSQARFWGVVQDMPALYGAADIFLLPTIYDPFSNACLEALASGCPVVTTRANGFSEIIEPDLHGSVIDDPRNVNQLCAALEYWSDKDRREQARTVNRELAQRYDISVNVEGTLEVLIGASPSVPR